MIKFDKENTATPSFSIIGTLTLVVTSGIVGLLSAEYRPISIQVAVVCVVFVYCSTRLKPFWESPAIVFGIFMLANGILGYLFSISLDTYGGTAEADTSLGDGLRLQTANLFFLSTLLVLIAATVVKSVGNRAHYQTAVETEIGLPGPKFGLVFASAVLVFAASLNGWPWLLSRSSRFTEDTGSTATLVSMLALAALLMLGITVTHGSRVGTSTAIILIILYGLYYFSLASRTLTLIPLLILIGSLVGGSRKKLKRKISLAFLVTLLLSPIPLFLRNQSSHGLVPYFLALNGLNFKIDDWLAAANNVIHGFGIVGTTAFSQPKIPTSSLAISLSPLSGQLSGWYEIAPELRLGFFTPYGALGEVFNQGWIFACLFLILLGGVFGFIQRSGSVLKGLGLLAILRYIPLGLMYLMVIQLTQYNLRSEMRLIYYAIIFQLALLLVYKLRSSAVGTGKLLTRRTSHNNIMKKDAVQ